MYEKVNKIPPQRIPESQKTKEWHKKTAKAYLELSNLTGGIRYNDLQRLYEYYNGTINDEDYKYALYPGNSKLSRKGFPSRIRNYPLIKPTVDLLLGEKRKRPFNYTVIATNSDAESIKETKKKELLKQNVEKIFLRELQRSGLDVGVDPNEQIPLPVDVERRFMATYKDMRAMIGQQALDYIVRHQRVKEKLAKAWFHFLVSGEVYTHKYVQNGETHYEIINPLDVDYDKNPDDEFVEDGDYALIRKHAHASTIIDKHYDELTPEEIDRLENPRHVSGSPFTVYNTRPSASEYSQQSERNRLIEWVIVYWKSRKKIGFLDYLSEETGEWETRIVDADYKPAKGESIVWEWVNEIRQTEIIDGDICVNYGPVYNSRSSLNNPSTAKLPINGRKYSAINAPNISIVSLGIPYQINFNVYKYRLELAIAKSKDLIPMFDINMIPKKWGIEKFMYHLEGSGIAWIDYNKEGVKLSPTHQNVLDLTIKTIESYIALLESIRYEWDQVSGVTQQRKGQVGQYDSVTGTQQSIMQSSHITEDLFAKFEELEERDLTGLLDISKEAWITGKTAAYILTDGSVEFLQIDGPEYSACEFGTFVSSSSKEWEKIQNARLFGQAMIQNGTPGSAILELWDSDNFAHIKAQIKQAEALAAQQQQAIKEAELEAQRENAAAAAGVKEREISSKENIAFSGYEKDILIKEMELASQGVDSMGNELSDEERSKLKAEIDKLKADTLKTKAEIRQRDEELRIKEHEATSKRIAAKKPASTSKPASKKK